MTIGMRTSEIPYNKKDKKGERRQRQRRLGRIGEGRQLRRRGPGVNRGDGISRRGILRSGHQGIGSTSAPEPRSWRQWRRKRRRRNEDLSVLQQMGIFDVKVENVETKTNEARAMGLEAQVFEAERSRAGGRTRSRLSSLKPRRGSRGLILRGKSTCIFWGRSYGRRRSPGRSMRRRYAKWRPRLTRPWRS